MDPEFITYQKYDDIDIVRELALVLDMHGLEYQIEDVFPSYALNVRPEDVEKVKQVLRDDDEGDNDDGEDEPVEADGVGTDYYLFAFTNDELLEVIANADEWNDTDVSLARKILTDKGVPINDAQLESLHEQHEAELHKPAKPQTFLIIVGYIMALLGGVMGIAIGKELWNAKKSYRTAK